MEAIALPSAAPRRPFSSRALWIAALVLSPLAYLGSFYLAKLLPARHSTITINRERGIEAATRFAASRQVDVRGWGATIGAQKDKDIAVVFAHVRPPALEQVTAASIVTVRFRSPASKEWFRALLTPTGRVIGFSINEPDGKPVTVTDAAAEKIAVSFLQEFLGSSAPFELPAPKMHFADRAKQDRVFEWKAPVPGLPEAKASFRVELAGDRVITEGCDVAVDPAYLKPYRPALPLYYGLLTLAGIYLAAVGIYAIVRYARRTFQKEVSHRRTLLVILIFVILSSFSIYYGAAQATLSVNGAPPTASQKIVLLIVFVAIFGVMGAFFGIAYGAGEGDVRAVYPGKLTSLDALLSGKLFSANVARSILAGGAFAGAMLLLQNLALLATHAVRPLDDNDIVSSLISNFPLGEAFAATALHALGRASGGLLLPLAFLRPRVRKEWIFYALLPLCTMLAGSISTDSITWRNFLIEVLASVAVTCVPFFFGDLLASVSGVVALDLVSKLIYRGVTVERWAQIGLPVVYVGVAFLLMEVYFAERGKTYEEWEVRPLYARHLAERLSLEAEIGAARQAQLRLLPDAPPKIAGLSIAGSCVPAREVGGDFYDFYPLDDHRLAVFVAEGGSRELASAMPIALAKGYLLHTARLDLSPVEVLRRLRDVLGLTLRGEGASISMMYALIDSSAGTVRFARTGVSPRLAINGNRAVEEVAVSRGNEVPIQHGAASLAERDTLVFYTDGLAAQIAERKREAVDRFLAKTSAKMRDSSAAELHGAILKAAIRRQSEPPLDDVTAVVIRLEEPGERALEVVA